MASHTLIGLDVGEKRIGIAVADDAIRIAVPFATVIADGSEIEQLAAIIIDQSADSIVVGYPRNQSGQPTAQTDFVERFAARLESLADKIVFQDESLTSVLAEERLKASRKPYGKADIDMTAAAIILQDYLEQANG